MRAKLIKKETIISQAVMAGRSGIATVERFTVQTVINFQQRKQAERLGARETFRLLFSNSTRKAGNQ